MLSGLREDIQTVIAKDPASKGVLEILFCYPGLHAIWLHRLAHFLWKRRLRFLSRLLSHINRFLTGIEIHPNAVIGRRFFIDHGMGVIIGETAEIGDDVLMYQGVILGGTALEKRKRHPTIGNDVVLGTGATLLGPITVGDGARIGANSVVLSSVPLGASAVGVRSRIVEDHREAVLDLEHEKLPDPYGKVIQDILEGQVKLEKHIKELEDSRGSSIVPIESVWKSEAEVVSSRGDGL